MFINIAFVISSLFVLVAGNWSIKNNEDSLKRVYSFRLFSRGHFQVINANTKAMNYLNLGFKNKNQDQLVEGLTHLETSLGFIYSLISELKLENLHSSLDKFIPVYEELIKKYETLLDRDLNAKDDLLRLEIDKELTALNQKFGFKESSFWGQRAIEFENIRNRNKIFQTLYWILIASITLGIIILQYLSSERKKMENELEVQRIQMVSNSRLAALGQFSASVAHEINNPLTVILWRIKALKKKSETKNYDATTLKEFQSIEDNSKRINSIILGIKTLSKNADSDQFDHITIRNIKKQLEDILSPKLDLLEMEYQFESSCFDLSVSVKEVQIIQVLVNLINNSIDAISDLTHKWVHISSYQENKNIVFTITDSGAGIPKKIRSQLFDLFFTTKSKNNEGTGIGLAMASQIIKAHNGTLNYNSNSKNTQFIITIPVS